jgi:hypothetical protein
LSSGFLRGNPRLQAGEETDSCGAGQGELIRRSGGPALITNSYSKVYNKALAARTEAWTRQERVNCNQTSAMLTAWKKTEELASLNEVSCVPLRQALRHL